MKRQTNPSAAAVRLRRRALARRRRGRSQPQSKSPEPKSSAESARLLAQLQLRQLELEVRNETLEKQLAERTATIRRLVRDLTLAEQREKARLAQFLHDHLQQLLVRAQYLLLTSRPEATGGVRPAFDELAGILREALQATGTLAVELSPPILREEGLAAALSWLGVWMREKHGLTVKVTSGPEQAPLSEELSVLLYQALRELLFNVVKHAQVKCASVAMDCKDAQVRIVVSDQGKGFDFAQAQTTASVLGKLGLFSVRERLALLNGQVEVESALGQGSRFTLRVPLGPPVPRSAGSRTK